MTVRIRDASLSDIASITAIYRESVLHGVASYELSPPDEAEMTARFVSITEKHYPYIGAEDENGAFLGYAYASPFRTRPAYRWLVEDSIYLAPEARGKGAGRALLAALVERCTALGFRSMVAVIGGAHPASVAVHRACGFEESGLLKATGFKHGRWLDTALMQRQLGEGATSEPDPSTYPGTLFPG
ncbi:N-acetyltransferase family protein [Rhizobiaceae bacterium n13]|uniref:N-acetyltransferase family protein n=1 Tax=Ferirhizobium litorale TaxID=2927786 RepID=A0AAE3QHX4_9HYPH|nr:N-acetyltransferase family protein [Fererhizobium litorale]MDI7862422.1 N-acetyltransferase family protein [Fererhizobium litorale]MDI7923691.1 N-acetyltransferase family protein [Fererhizobium litorale]